MKRTRVFGVVASAVLLAIVAASAIGLGAAHVAQAAATQGQSAIVFPPTTHLPPGVTALPKGAHNLHVLRYHLYPGGRVVYVGDLTQMTPAQIHASTALSLSGLLAPLTHARQAAPAQPQSIPNGCTMDVYLFFSNGPPTLGRWTYFTCNGQPAINQYQEFLSLQHCTDWSPLLQECITWSGSYDQIECVGANGPSWAYCPTNGSIRYWNCPSGWLVRAFAWTTVWFTGVFGGQQWQQAGNYQAQC